MSNAAILTKYRPAVFHAWGGHFPILYLNKREPLTIRNAEGVTETVAGVHAFLPRQACTEKELNLLENAGIFRGGHVDRKTFMGLNLIVPASPKPTDTDYIQYIQPNRIDKGYCDVIRKIAAKLSVSAFQTGYIPALAMKSSFFRKVIENFDGLAIEIQLVPLNLHGMEMMGPMHFKFGGLVLQILDDKDFTVPDHIANINEVKIAAPHSEFVLEPVKMVPSPYCVMTMSAGLDTTFVVKDGTTKVTTLTEALGISYN